MGIGPLLLRIIWSFRIALTHKYNQTLNVQTEETIQQRRAPGSTLDPSHGATLLRQFPETFNPKLKPYPPPNLYPKQFLACLSCDVTSQRQTDPRFDVHLSWSALSILFVVFMNDPIHNKVTPKRNYSGYLIGSVSAVSSYNNYRSSRLQMS